MGKYDDGHLDDYLSPGDGVLDVGANGGSVTAQCAATVGPTGYVLAVEPVPETFERLLEGIRKKWPQAHAVQSAVGSVVGETVIHPEGSQSSRWPSLTRSQPQGITVPMTTIDALARLVPNLKGVKIDVQGGEWEALLGASETLNRPDVAWQIELWPRGLDVAGASVELVIDILERAGLQPMKRTWAQVRAAVAGLSPESYLDVVARHG